MSNVKRIQEAISVLEMQRAVVGARTVDTTIDALKEQLSLIENGFTDHQTHPAAQRKQVTTIFATVTGLPGISESRTDTNLLDIIKILWRRLDAAITEQGGMVDKHMGDGVMGIFGVPVSLEDDPERAVRAALTMRAVLSDFVSEMSSFENASLEAWRQRNQIDDTHPFGSLQLRIGINTGPVLLGAVGRNDEYTVIGSAVNVASRLEQAAPAGSILISHETYMMVRGIFAVEPLGPIVIKGRQEPVQAYLALGANPRSFYLSSRGVEGIKTLMVGRTHEMIQLQNALHAAAKAQIGQVVTVVGDAGIGKSRLIYEYIEWIRAQPGEVMVLKGRTDQRMKHLPFSPIRDLLSAFLGIQDTDLASVVEDKLARGLEKTMTLESEEVHQRALAIGQLLGLTVSRREKTPVSQAETPQARERVFNYLVQFFTAAASSYPASVMILEDLHWADERSWDLIDSLSQICKEAPLLLICLTRTRRTELRHKQTIESEAAPAAAGKVLQLATLSKEESHRLVTDILRKLPEIPEDLSSLIVERAEGNPYYVEELIKILIEDGVIVTSHDRWYLQQIRLRSVRIPPTLTGVLQARLDRLSSLERSTLQRAAAIGRTFWDGAVIQMAELAEKPLDASETMVALQALEKRELVFRQQVSGFANSEAYFFKHAVLRDVTYESVLLRERPLYHKLVADWLAKESGERMPEYAGLIAEHYEQAGERITAAELYETAANRAREMYNPDIAIDHLCKALFLLTESQQHAAWQLRLQEQLGQLLLMQARLVETVQTYMTMQYIAEKDGDLTAQAHAWNGLAAVRCEQADYGNMLHSAIKAEQYARLIGADSELTTAILNKSLARSMLCDTEAAAADGEHALARSSRMQDHAEVTRSLYLLGLIHIRSGGTEQAKRFLRLLEEKAILLSKVGPLPELALAELLLGKIYNEVGLLDKAAFCLLGASAHYREMDVQQAIAETLNALGETARLRNDHDAAMSIFQEATSIADAIGDQIGKLKYQVNLGGALVELRRFGTAEGELNKANRLAQDISLVVKWRGLAKALVYLAEAYLGQDRLDEAAQIALSSRSHAQPVADIPWIGASWRVLGKIAARLPEDKLPMLIDGAPYQPSDCFSESLRLLRRAAGTSPFYNQEQLSTLNAWLEVAQSNGDEKQVLQLKAEMDTLLGQLKTVFQE